jgi:hypothetical protein
MWGHVACIFWSGHGDEGEATAFALRHPFPSREGAGG